MLANLFFCCIIRSMNNKLLTLIVIIISGFSFLLGNLTANPVEIKTVEKEKIVHPDFKFNTGDKKYCDLGTQVKPCEIIGKKSNGSYVIKYNHEGIAGGDKIITIDGSDIVE